MAAEEENRCFYGFVSIADVSSSSHTKFTEVSDLENVKMKSFFVIEVECI